MNSEFLRAMARKRFVLRSKTPAEMLESFNTTTGPRPMSRVPKRISEGKTVVSGVKQESAGLICSRARLPWRRLQKQTAEFLLEIHLECAVLVPDLDGHGGRSSPNDSHDGSTCKPIARVGKAKEPVLRNSDASSTLRETASFPGRTQTKTAGQSPNFSFSGIAKQFPISIRGYASGTENGPEIARVLFFRHSHFRREIIPARRPTLAGHRARKPTHDCQTRVKLMKRNRPSSRGRFARRSGPMKEDPSSVQIEESVAGRARSKDSDGQAEASETTGALLSWRNPRFSSERPVRPGKTGIATSKAPARAAAQHHLSRIQNEEEGLGRPLSISISARFATNGGSAITV